MVTLWELVSLGVQSTEYGVPSGTGASHLTPAKGTNVSNMTPDRVAHETSRRESPVNVEQEEDFLAWQ